MEQLTSGTSGQVYRLGPSLDHFGEGFYRGFAGTEEVLLRIAAPGTPEVALLRAEADLLQRAAGPRVAKLRDRGRSERHYFLSLEGPIGKSLAALISESDLAAAPALDLVLQAVDTLASLHAAGIVWGSFRPQAFWADKAGQMTLVNLREAGTTRTLAAAVYAAPELAASQPPTVQSDVYSVGVFAYELLAGRPPFVGADAAELLVKHVAEPAPDLAASCAHLPAGVAAAINACLAKRPEDRPADLTALRATLGAAHAELVAEEQTRLVDCPRCAGRVPAGERCPLCNGPLKIAPAAVAKPRRKLWPLIAIGMAGFVMLCSLLVLFTPDEEVAATVPTAAPTAALEATTPLPATLPSPLPTAAAALPPEGALVAEADNVADPNIDLISALGMIEGDELVAVIDVAGRVASAPGTTYQVFFDGDGAQQGNTGTAWPGLAADLTVLFRTGDKDGQVLRWDGTSWQGVGAAEVTAEGGRLTMRAPAEWLGEATELRFAALAANSEANLADFAPAQGEPGAVAQLP